MVRSVRLFADAVGPVVVRLGHLDLHLAVLVGAPRVRRQLRRRRGSRDGHQHIRPARRSFAGRRLGRWRRRRRRRIAGRSGAAVAVGGGRLPAEIQHVVVVVGIARVFRRREGIVVVSVAVVALVGADGSFRGGRELILAAPADGVHGHELLAAAAAAGGRCG